MKVTIKDDPEVKQNVFKTKDALWSDEFNKICSKFGLFGDDFTREYGMHGMVRMYGIFKRLPRYLPILGLSYSFPIIAELEGPYEWVRFEGYTGIVNPISITIVDESYREVIEQISKELELMETP